MHGYFEYELHRQWVAQLERDADLRRLLPAAARRRNRLVDLIALVFRRRSRPVARAPVGARACR